MAPGSQIPTFSFLTVLFSTHLVGSSQRYLLWLCSRYERWYVWPDLSVVQHMKLDMTEEEEAADFCTVPLPTGAILKVRAVASDGRLHKTADRPEGSYIHGVPQMSLKSLPM